MDRIWANTGKTVPRSGIEPTTFGCEAPALSTKTPSPPDPRDGGLEGFADEGESGGAVRVRDQEGGEFVREVGCVWEKKLVPGARRVREDRRGGEMRVTFDDGG